LIGKDKLPRIADSVTLVDLSPTLLKVATDRYGSDMDQTLADVTELPFADQSFDLITSGGLIYSLGTIRQEPYFEEVSRVLRAGGIYLDGDYLPGSPRHIKAGSVERFQLEWLIKSHAFLEPPFDPLEDVEDKAAYFEKFGLKLSYKEYLDETFQNRIQIRILEKAA
jgi:ubiquinone/menaquinone biosynthesis C-methylase UbiE